MRSTRSNKKTSNIKNKSCVVRVEKMRPTTAKLKAGDKKMTGPLKKRPLSAAKKVAPPKEEKTEEQDDSNTTLVAGRSRRTVKPNPKYTSDDVVTTKAIRRKGSRDDSDDDFEEDYDDDDVEINSEANEDQSDVSSEDVPAKKMRTTKVSANNPNVSRGRGRPKTQITPGRSSLRTTLQLPQLKSTPKDGSTEKPPNRSAERPMVRQVPIRSDKPPQVRIVERTSIEETSPHHSYQGTMKGGTSVNQAQKRKMDTSKEKLASSIMERNKRLNIALFDSAKSPAPTTATNKINAIRTRPAANSLQQNRNLVAQKKTFSVNANSKKPAPVVINLTNNAKAKKTALKEETGDALTSNTMDDFETMPTFTIVNIHDIQKGDVLVEQKESKSPELKLKSSINATPATKNRRKTGHTTILSDKIDLTKVSEPLPRSPFPPRSAQRILNNNSMKKTNATDPRSEKPAPRILNSNLCKKTPPVTPLIGKSKSAEMKSAENSFASDKSPLSKENSDIKKPLIATNKKIQRKLPPEKTVIERQGNKLIKKITCYENWHVLNIPEVKPPVIRNTLELNLVELGNSAHEIKLPSSQWTCRVAIQTMSAAQLCQKNLVKYTGEMHDEPLSETEKEKYQPVSVMFRRTSSSKDRIRLPFDRAVIFKNKTFFTNIDGKNIRLLGAPTSISEFEDIETLLKLVDVLTLKSDFVEPTTTIA